jgi:hypothetical protein
MGSAARHRPPKAAFSHDLRGFLRRNAPLLALVAFWFLLLVLAIPQELVQDSWLTLLSGREVIHHGLPSVDTLAVWTHGKAWIDQQWLSQVFFYGIWATGGIKAVLLAHVALLTLMFASGLAAARSLGASRPSIVVAGTAALAVAPWSMQLRAQTLAECFFVWLLWLLASDSRAPSRRVFLSLPLLVLWANVHGTVVLGALLVILRGLAHKQWSRRAVVLTVAPVACLFASPYGLSLGGYYHRMLVNPTLRSFIDEWGPSTPSHKTAAFFVLAGTTIWLLGRYRNRLTGFEQVALAVILVAAVTSIRTIVWFGLTALVLLPLLLDGALARVSFRRVERFGRPVVPIAIAVVAATFGFAVSRPTAWYEQAWPTVRARDVIHSLACRSSVRIFADDRYADWLLWAEPETRGRVAYDVRFELFDPAQLLRLAKYRSRIGDDWRRAAKGYDVILFDPLLQASVEQGMLAHGDVVRQYADTRLAILAKRPLTSQIRDDGAGCDSSSPASASANTGP